MFVKEIKDYDSFSAEADIIVSDGKYDLLCYCHPVENCITGAKVLSLNALFAKNVKLCFNANFRIEKLLDYYSYKLFGKIKRVDNPLICIGKLEIELDCQLPRDLNEGDFIECEVSRISCVISE